MKGWSNGGRDLDATVGLNAETSWVMKPVKSKRRAVRFLCELLGYGIDARYNRPSKTFACGSRTAYTPLISSVIECPLSSSLSISNRDIEFL